MLALLDVLGFKTWLKNVGIDEVHAKYEELIATAVLKPPDRCLGLAGELQGPQYTVLFSLPVRYAYFSDTILLWLPLDRLFPAPFISRCANLVCDALKAGIKLRGAIALGEAVLHKASSTYIGPPLVEAAELEKAQNWMGVMLSHSATWPDFLARLDPGLIIEYEAPVKDDAKVNDYLSPIVLDWPRRWREVYGASASDRLAELEEHPYNSPTNEFIQFSMANENWFEKPDNERKGAKLKMRPLDQFQTEL